MHGKYFTYDGEDSQTHRLAIAGLEQNDDVVFSLGREVLASQLNRYRNRVGHMGTRWSDVLVFNIQFIKSPCDSGSAANMYFTEDEVNEINAWLTSPDYPTLFHMYDYDFERDSSDSMILVDGTNIGAIVVNASGYYPVTYTISDESATASIDATPQYDEEGAEILMVNPSTEISVNKYNGYYSLIINDNDFLILFTSITVDNVEYSNIHTNSWLSTYAKEGGKIADSYTILVNTEKVLNNKYDYFGVFSDVQAQVIDGNVVGFDCTFTTDSPFAWTHEIHQEVDGSATFTVNSAEKYREIYPLIEITATPDWESSATRSEVTIGNSVDGLSMTLNLRQGDTTTIDAMQSIIKDHSGLVSFTDLGISDVDYIYWPRLYNGTNTITIDGNATAVIKYREPRKVGDY